ncbi:acyl-CoA dehydrogenase family protein [Marinobacterium rhizophilum]|uniref:Acyl-CoA dehydrogenase family protein n=1 Tax=Marinobacterium rhizophilum TaxID=420402 RepID=A0ABY5HMA7_9GAMM|nr:acyl-CoA dehydrogenase family protein [Marinobacterium rhizophilum]UTW12409.1 acyl-CoA dehydrogenase family protein [Marinobacterium rhizophilum]
MDFSFSDDQLMLQDSLGKLLASLYPAEKRHSLMAGFLGTDAAAWGQFADMGLFGIGVDEAYEGFGGDTTDLCLVCEGMGQRLALEPYSGQQTLAVPLLQRAGSEQQCAELLPRLVDGSLKLAAALEEPHSRFDRSAVATRASKVAGGYVLSGHKAMVLGGDCADKLILSARTSGNDGDAAGISLFIVDVAEEGVDVQRYPLLDGRGAADIRFREVPLSEACRLGCEGEALAVIEQASDIATAALCAEAVGAMAEANRLTAEYLETRKQFGREIGRFQTLAHRLVDMELVTEQARSMMLYAAMMADTQDATARRVAISQAKVQVGRSARQVLKDATQLHGGIGVTDECLISHYVKKLLLCDLLFGGQDHHLAQLAAALPQSA